MAAIAWGSVFYGHSVYLTALTGDGRWSIGQISTGITIFWISSLPGTLFVGYLIDKKGGKLGCLHRRMLYRFFARGNKLGARPLVNIRVLWNNGFCLPGSWRCSY